MTDEPTSPTERVRGFVARARSAPATIEGLADQVAGVRADLDDLRRRLEARGAPAQPTGTPDDGGDGDDGDAPGPREDRPVLEVWPEVRDLEERMAGVDGAVAGHAAALHRAVAAPARQAAARALAQELGPPPELHPGLSIFTLCWNHGDLLEDAVRSGLATLRFLGPHRRGEVLILDDASTDRTASVAAELAEAHPRVRVIRAPVNLGLALARTTLLHAARTTHAFHLDADNTASPSGVACLYEAAVATGAALTYGNVVQVGEGGQPVGPVSNEPPSPALFRSNYVDTMAVTDVAAYRGLGGWSADPLLEHVDDWHSVLRVMTAGLLVTFVPAVVGRYRVLDTAFHRSVADPRIGADRVGRVLDPTGRRRGPEALEGVAAVAYDLVAGPLWATPEALRQRPDLAPSGPPARTEPRTGPRVLVVAPGGVANLGDDAITVRGLARLRDVMGALTGVGLGGPDRPLAVDLVTDGADLPPGRGAARWLGPLRDVLPGLGRDELGATDPALEAAAAALGIGSGHWRPLDLSAYSAAVFLGGGSLASSWSEGLVAPRAVLAAALRHAGVPYACSGQGIGPLDGDSDRALVGGLLAGAVAVGCRDQASVETARELPGVDRDRVALTGDDALGLAPADVLDLAGDEALDLDGDDMDLPDLVRPGWMDQMDWPGWMDRPVLGVTLRRADYVGGLAQDPVRAWARAADDLAVERGWDVVGIALNAQDPEPEAATLALVRATVPLRARWHVVDCGDDPRHLVATVAELRALAAQSFHAALFALAAGVPAVLGAGSPYYRGKAAGLAGATGLPPELEVTDPARMGTALDSVEAALPAVGTVLDGAADAVTAWWDRLPALLGLLHRR